MRRTIAVTGHKIDFSLALDFGQFFDALQQRAQQATTFPFLCPQFADANRSMADLARWTAESTLAPWRKLRSLRVEYVGALSEGAENSALLVETATPLELLSGLGMMMGPELGELAQLPPDGKPQVVRDQGDERFVLAVLPDRITGGAGKQAEGAMQRIALAPTVADAAALSLRFGPPLPGDARAQLVDSDTPWKSVYGQLAGVLVESRLTTRGVETLLRFELQAPQ